MIIGIITAREGSKGIANKNLADLGGKPLIEYTFEAAQECTGLDRVFLTTDSKSIIQLAKSKYSRIEVPFIRPPELASDTTSHVQVVNHLLTELTKSENLSPDAFVLFQPTSPFRAVKEIEQAILMFRQKGLDSLLGVAKAMHHPADYVWRLPGETGFREVFERPPTLRRQDLPEVFSITGSLFICNCKWYWAQQRFYDRSSHLFQMSDETLLDIDSPFDLQLAQGYLLVSHRNG